MTLPERAVVVALLTPYRPDGSVDLDALARHVEQLVEAGVDGLMPAGTTGEGALLDEDEILAVVEVTLRASAGAASVLAHVGRPATAATVRLLRRAVEAGADMLSAVVPYYYGLDDRQVVAHYEVLLEAAGTTPLFAYTIPDRARNELSAAAVRELAVAGLAGVKDSTKSLERHREYLACGVPVLMGSDGLVFQALELGAAGCISAIANLRPDLLLELARASREGRPEDAERLQGAVSELRAELAREPALVALKRAVAARVPGYAADVRRPLG